MELRQLRYFVILAEELHFGRAAQRYHVGQSALSQQLRMLERELGVRLLDRSTHHVELTKAGRAFLAEVRKILLQVERAATLARSEAAKPTLKAGILDPSYDSMALVLNELQESHPDLKIQQVRASLPQQYRWLADGRIDVGFGRVFLPPQEISSKVFRLDRLGVLAGAQHRFAALDSVPAHMLADEQIMMADDEHAAELNQLVTDLFQSADVVYTPYQGSSDSVHGAVFPVSRGRCVLCIPGSGAPPSPHVVWRPLTAPNAVYRWSVLWRKGDKSRYVQAVISSALHLSRERAWLRDPPREERVRPLRSPIGV